MIKVKLIDVVYNEKPRQLPFYFGSAAVEEYGSRTKKSLEKVIFEQNNAYEHTPGIDDYLLMIEIGFRYGQLASPPADPIDMNRYSAGMIIDQSPGILLTVAREVAKASEMIVESLYDLPDEKKTQN